jgi:hypothetical protein
MLLDDLGGETVVASVGRLDPSTKRFVSATWSGDTAIGYDFPLRAGEAYFIHLHQPVNEFSP